VSANQALSLDDFDSFIERIKRPPRFQAQYEWVAATDWFEPKNLATLSTN
jgi:hypothetical protein